MTYQVATAVVLGIICGKLWPAVQIWQSVDLLVTVLLYALLFFIGVELGQNKQIWQEIKTQGWILLLVPLGVLLGTFAGGAVAAFILQMPTGDALAVSAGFGWYSLAGVLLTQVGTVELGALAFLANVLREILAFLLIPITARSLGSYLAIAPGGATTMDTTLPLIAKATNNEATVAAFVSGAVLSALVPILVPLFLG